MNKGDVYSSNAYGDFVIVDYINAKNVIVRFVDTGFVTTSESVNVLRGSVKDKMMPIVYDVGFVGEGRFSPSVNRKHTGAYVRWKGMLKRCYCEESLKVRPTYRGCTVCAEWHNFQNFAEWYESNHVDGRHMDKDIKIDGNKIYSPSTCLFVTQKENNKKARETKLKNTREMN